MEIAWHPAADREFDAGVDWYDARQGGLGARFEDRLLEAVDAVAKAPESWPVWPGWDREPVVRSKRVAQFPYRIVYVLAGEQLTIVAVAHGSRQPGYWRARVPD